MKVDCETQLKQAPVRQDVGRRSRGVAVYHQRAAHETLSEYPRQHGEQIKHTSDPGFTPEERNWSAPADDSRTLLQGATYNYSSVKDFMRELT